MRNYLLISAVLCYFSENVLLLMPAGVMASIFVTMGIPPDVAQTVVGAQASKLVAPLVVFPLAFLFTRSFYYRMQQLSLSHQWIVTVPTIVVGIVVFLGVQMGMSWEPTSLKHFIVAWAVGGVVVVITNALLCWCESNPQKPEEASE